MQKKIKIIHLKGVGNADILACSINGTSPHLCGKKRACHPVHEAVSFRLAASECQLVEGGFVNENHLLDTTATITGRRGGIISHTFPCFRDKFQCLSAPVNIKSVCYILGHKPRFAVNHLHTDVCAAKCAFVDYVLQGGRNFAGKILIREHNYKNCDKKKSPRRCALHIYAGRMMQPIVSARPP